MNDWINGSRLLFLEHLTYSGDKKSLSLSAMMPDNLFHDAYTELIKTCHHIYDGLRLQHGHTEQQAYSVIQELSYNLFLTGLSESKLEIKSPNTFNTHRLVGFVKDYIIRDKPELPVYERPSHLLLDVSKVFEIRIDPIAKRVEYLYKYPDPWK